MLQVINEALSLALSTIIGLASIRYMNRFFKILLVQLLVWDVFYIGSYIVTMFYKSNGWWFNIHLPVETFFLAVAAFVHFTDIKLKRLVAVLFIFFMVLYLILTYTSKPGEFNNYSMAFEGVVVTVSYGIIIFQVFREGILRQRSPYIWACIGLIIYFACNIPYFTAFNYLNVHYPKTSYYLFRIITDVLANIRYVLLAFAFWQLRRQSAADTALNYG